MLDRIPRMFGSVLMLVGAFAIGSVIHRVVVRGVMDPLSPLAVGGTLVGVVVILVGMRLEREFEPSEYVPDEESAEDDDEPEFDEELSPVPGDRLEDREADEGYENG